MRTEPGTGRARDLWWAGTSIGFLVAAFSTLQLGSLLSTGVWLDIPAALRGSFTWTGADTAAAVLVTLTIAAVMIGGAYLHRSRRGRTSHRGKAKAMGDPAGLSMKAARDAAQRGRMTANGSPGLLYGKAIADGLDLYAGWRAGLYIEMGPGMGKSRGCSIPMVIEAPGVVVATSCKRDIADAIRGVCEKRGTFWLFDPQQIAGGRPAFWYDPLRRVTGPVEADELAQLFVGATTKPGATGDDHFGPKGEALLSNLLLAAAVGGHQIDQVYKWATNWQEAAWDAVPALTAAGFALSAHALAGTCNLPDRERGSVFSTAEKSISFLTSPEILAWITDSTGRPEFRPERFVKSGRDTLLALSLGDGPGSAGPITTALTAACMSAAVREAQHHPHGRLPVPLVCALDEVANICRWQRLPDLYSHYGSAGITLISLFQSWRQGVEAFGETGMWKLWGAATVRIVGGGLADDQHLATVSRLIDDQYVERRSIGTSTGRGTSRTVNVSYDRQPILSVGELSQLPEGRFVVIPSGQPPVLGELIPISDRPLADAVAVSVAKYEPGGPTW